MIKAKMQIARRAIIALLLVTMVLCSWFALLDSPATQRVDSGLKRALISFAAARALNAAISVVQGTELSIQPMGVGINLTLGQVLDPINDLVEQFSSLMLVACVAFGVQKILISVGGYWPVNLILTIAALCWAWLFFRQLQPPAWLSRILVVLLMVRFAIPMVTIGTDLLFQKFLVADLNASQQVIDTASGQVTELNLPDQTPENKPDQLSENNPDQTPENNPDQISENNPVQPSLEDKGLASTLKDIKDKIGEAIGSGKTIVTKTMAALRQKGSLKKQFKEIVVASEKWVEHFIHIIVIFLLQTLIIPILLLWALYAVAKGTFELPKQIPNVISKPQA